jgi:tetratricopeptide (TPR) repeat protein
MAGSPSRSMFALGIDPTELVYSKGFAFHADGRYAEAAEAFRVMLQIAPTDERGWLALGDCHEKVGQKRVALEIYGAGSVAAQPAPRCLISRFRILYDAGHFSEADAVLNDADSLAADDEQLSKIVSDERRVRP